MAFNSSIQFKGKESVMQAFESKGIEAWSIFQFKQFIHKGIGGEDLAAFLEMLCTGGTNAIYTLKVYEGVTNAGAIKEKTECDGSFNFRLNDERQEITGSQYHSYNRFDTIQKELLELKQQLADRDNENDDEPETIGTVVNTAVLEIIKEPKKALEWVTVLNNIMPGLFPGAATVQPQPSMRSIQATVIPASMGTTEVKQELSEDQLTRLYNCTEILYAVDPLIIEHMEKLVQIATEKPNAFKNLLSMLEAF